MFGKRKNNSVHDLIRDEIKDVETCLVHFEGFLSLAADPDTSVETLKIMAEKIDDAEAVADVSLRRMIDTLGAASLLPATRQDLIELATSCDKVANKCEHTSAMIYYQHFLFPAEFKAPLTEILTVTRTQFEILEKAIIQMFESFRELSADHSILDEIRKHESHIDTIEKDLYRKIFMLPIGLAEQTQMAHFVELICDISDIIENIADRIQIMLITRKA